MRDAFSFGLALQASKQLSRKHSVGISLGYGLYQTRTSVGKRVDSSLIFGNQANSYTVNGPYFNNSNSTDYINHYHFIQADLDLQTRFRLFRVVSLRWQLGAGAAVLVASNGLHYSSSNNVSYKDRSLLTTLQTNISTGFDIGIGKQPLLYIGPQWKYFVSHLSKQPGEDQHLVQAALRVSFVFPPKKK
ncbi:MAG: hypothetical protein NVS3B15_12320 [Sediminibacterium sp.]